MRIQDLVLVIDASPPGSDHPVPESGFFLSPKELPVNPFHDTAIVVNIREGLTAPCQPEICRRDIYLKEEVIS